jgi:hypothetical protein
MPQFTTSLNDDIRQWVLNNKATFAVLVDDTDTNVTTIDIGPDSRATITNSASTNPATIEIVVSGSDDDIPVPTTINRIEYYPSSSVSDMKAYDDFPNASIETSGDTLTLATDIEVPQV